MQNDRKGSQSHGLQGFLCRAQSDMILYSIVSATRTQKMLPAPKGLDSQNLAAGRNAGLKGGTPHELLSCQGTGGDITPSMEHRQTHVQRVRQTVSGEVPQCFSQAALHCWNEHCLHCFTAAIAQDQCGSLPSTNMV